MKRLICQFFLAACLLFSCHQDERITGMSEGLICIDLGVEIGFSEVTGTLKSIQGIEDFHVTIYTASGNLVAEYAHASEVPAEIPMEAGEYYVVAHSDNNLPAAFENPYYYGISETFVLDANESETVSVTCRLANTMISVVYGETLKSEWTEYSTLVASLSGSLEFTKTETRTGFFQPLPLQITVSLSRNKPDGTPEIRQLTGSISDPKPARHYELHINASTLGGIAAIQLILDDSAIPVEIVEVSDGQQSPVPGPFGPGEILISEIMYDPSAMTDATGEWFEVYNTTSRALNLRNLVLFRDNEHHVVNTDKIIQPHGYLVFARSAEAAGSGSYVYGSSLSLTNSGAILSLANFGTDGTDGTIIFSVNYAATGFPGGTGASVILSPLRMNAAQAVMPESWCTSVTPFATGDLGTPSAANDACLN